MTRDRAWSIEVGDGPVVATAIHAGHEVRPEVAAWMALSEEDRRREEDPLTSVWASVGDSSVLVDVYERMRETHAFTAAQSFNISLRVFRGGGLTKDVVYLRGLHDLLLFLAEDHSFERLLLGKYSLQQVPAVNTLLEEGYLAPPALLPRYLEDDSAKRRLTRCGELDVTRLHRTNDS